MEEEIWEDIPGYEGLYQVSNMGRFISTYNHSHRGVKPHIINGFICKNGYRGISLSKGGKEKRYYAHRIVAAVFVDNPNNYYEVDHINCDRADCRASNLRWVTRAGNLRNKNTIIKISLIAKSEQSYRVAAINPSTNTVEYIYPSIEGAARHLKCHSSDIARGVKNGYTVSNGFRWVKLKKEVYESIIVLPETI